MMRFILMRSDKAFFVACLLYEVMLNRHMHYNKSSCMYNVEKHRSTSSNGSLTISSHDAVKISSTKMFMGIKTILRYNLFASVWKKRQSSLYMLELCFKLLSFTAPLLCVIQHVCRTQTSTETSSYNTQHLATNV